MINRTNEIQRIINENGYTSYLEIGIGNGANFSDIQVDRKEAVDPMLDKVISSLSINVHRTTSDKFFEKNRKTFDVIFIDGLHHADQVEQDILNAWACLTIGGQMIIHDVKPLDEKCQRVPREQTSWTGDVWRAWYGLKKTHKKLKLDYIDERVGLAIVHKTRHKMAEGFVDRKTTYEKYNSLKGWEI